MADGPLHPDGVLGPLLLFDVVAPRVTLIELHGEQSRGVGIMGSPEIQPRSCDRQLTPGQGSSLGGMEVTDGPGLSDGPVLLGDMRAWLPGAFSAIL